jgi:hypothetical protein
MAKFCHAFLSMGVDHSSLLRRSSSFHVSAWPDWPMIWPAWKLNWLDE